MSAAPTASTTPPEATRQRVGEGGSSHDEAGCGVVEVLTGARSLVLLVSLSSAAPISSAA